MKIINNQYEFVNNHQINKIKIEEKSLTNQNYELISIVLPKIKAYAKRLVFFENIYLNDRAFFNSFVEKKIFNWSLDYNKKKISHDCYPSFNKKLFLHKNKFMAKMAINTLENMFTNDSSIDFSSNKLCFFKPNQLALKSTKWKKFEFININYLNNFDREFENNNYEINYDIEKNIIKLFEKFFVSEKFYDIIIKAIKKISIILSFLDFYLDKNLIMPSCDDIICGTDSRILTKLIRYKLIRKQKKLHVFEHGARTLFFKNDLAYLIDHRLIFASKYYVTGRGQYNSLKNYIDVLDKIKLSKNAEPKIKKIIKQDKLCTNNKKILYVMDIIATRNKFSEPHDHESFYYEKIYNCINKFLNKNNYYYKIKSHPDSKLTFENNSNFTNSNINYLYKEFDILLFDHASSTAFAEAINTNKKVILLDFSQNNFEKEFNKIINNRCSLIDTEIDIYGNTHINYQYLKDVIEDNKIIEENTISKTRDFFLP